MGLRTFSSALFLLALVGAGDARHVQQPTDTTSKASNIKQTEKPAIEFGHEGGNLRPYRVVIYEDGRVKTKEGAVSLKVDSVSSNKVKELVSKATDKAFWKRGPIAARPSLPDFGFVFVRVRARSGKTSYHRGAQTGPLGEFYSELSDLILASP
jgi:hypothetical protein